MLITKENIYFKVFYSTERQRGSQRDKAIHHSQLQTGKAHAKHRFCGRFHGQLGKYMYKVVSAPKIMKPITDHV